MDPIAIRVWLRDQGHKRYWESSSRSSFKAGSRWKHSYKARYNKNISWWAIVNATVLRCYSNWDFLSMQTLLIIWWVDYYHQIWVTNKKEVSSWCKELSMG